jgi:hypothetical protein
MDCFLAFHETAHGEISNGSMIAPYRAEHSSWFGEYPVIEAYIEKLDALPEVQAAYKKDVPAKL